MRYVQLRPYGELERLAGRPVRIPPVCQACGKKKHGGETELRVRFVDQPPYPDALGVLFGQEWAISDPMRKVIDSTINPPPGYAAVLGEDGQPVPYQQVLLGAALRAGQESVRGGDRCDECGGYVQLTIDPLFLIRPEPEPPIAYLMESPGVILVREDLAAAFRDARLDLDLRPVLFEGEPVPSPGPTTEGQDWSDVRSS